MSETMAKIKKKGTTQPRLKPTYVLTYSAVLQRIPSPSKSVKDNFHKFLRKILRLGNYKR